MEYNTVGEWLGLIGMMGFYIWVKWFVYSREYKDNKEVRNGIENKDTKELG